MLYVYALIAFFTGLIAGRLLRSALDSLPKILLEEGERKETPKDPAALYFKKFDWGMGALFGGSVLLFPLGAPLIYVLITAPLLIGCFLTDLKHRILPDAFTLSLMWIGLLGSLVPIFVTPAEAIIGAAAGYGLFWLFNVLYRAVRGVEGMYPGDFKLNAAIGASVGIQGLLPVVGVSLILLLLAGIIFRLLSREKTTDSFLSQELPYGCSAALVLLVFQYLLLFQL